MDRLSQKSPGLRGGISVQEHFFVLHIQHNVFPAEFLVPDITYTGNEEVRGGQKEKDALIQALPFGIAVMDRMLGRSGTHGALRRCTARLERHEKHDNKDLKQCLHLLHLTVSTRRNRWRIRHANILIRTNNTERS